MLNKPFLRRASTPGDISPHGGCSTSSSDNDEQSDSRYSDTLTVPTDHDSSPPPCQTNESTPRRPVSFRNTQTRSVSFRPARFIKAATSSISTSSSASSLEMDVSDDMKSFIQYFDQYCQHIYMEGYIIRQNTDGSKTRCFIELCGSTLSLWDAEVQSQTVMPQYYNVSDAMVYKSTSENEEGERVMVIQINGKRSLALEASDSTTFARWVSAIRLAGFEKKKLHLLFTLRLLLRHFDPEAAINPTTTSTTVNGQTVKWESYVQVCTSGSEWQKYWMVVSDSKKKDERKLFGKKSSASSSTVDAQIMLLDNKKAKAANLTMVEVTHAYAMYPESSQLIDRACIMRIEGLLQRKQGKQSQNEYGHLLIMADNSQQMAMGLLAVLDAFKLYGRPQTLLSDATNEQALNFGEGITATQHRLYLDVEDVVQVMDTAETDARKIELVFQEAFQRKLNEPVRHPGTRANSLPLITVVCEENGDVGGPASRQRSASVCPTPHDNDEETNAEDTDEREQPAGRPGSRMTMGAYKLTHQIADSSDESEDEEDGEDDEEDDVDSDDEPIAKTKSQTSRANNNNNTASKSSAAAAESLIPDFDFGNSLDLSSGLGTKSSSSSSLHDTKSSSQPTLLLSDDGPSSRSRQASISVTKEPESSSSLFGDFSLSTDFSKYMLSPDKDSSGGSAAARKYSLPAKLFDRDSMMDRPSLSGGASSSSFLDSSNGGFLSSPLDFDHHRRASWDPQNRRSSEMGGHWGGEDDHEDNYSDGRGSGERHRQRHPYDMDQMDGHSYEDDHDDNTPIIPGLNDHFAPQNSLLDNYIGEQLSAKEQIEYCRATGQPLIQIEPSKSRVPEGGFVGMISRREKERKEGNHLKISERVQQHHQSVLLEREKERRLNEQRQQQWMQYQVG